MKMQAQQPGVGHKAEALGKSPWQMLKITFNEWTLDKAPQSGASLAYYTLFSLAPLLLIVLAIAGLIVDPSDVQTQLNDEFKRLLGDDGAQAVMTLVEAAQKPEEGFAAGVVGLIVLALGATGVFVQLKDALNTIWNVRVRPGQGIWGLVRNYFLSF